MKFFKKGLLTGLILQLAIGPVFLYLVNLSLQTTICDALAGALAVTLVDYFYILLSILGVGKILQQPKIKKIFTLISSLILMGFGLAIFYNLIHYGIRVKSESVAPNIIANFFAVFFLTISNPLTIVFFTSLFSVKASQENLNQKELFTFGFGTGLATFLFMSAAVILVALIKTTIPIMVVFILNFIVAGVLILYSLWQLGKFKL